MVIEIQVEDYQSFAEDRQRLQRDIFLKQRIIANSHYPADINMVARDDQVVVGIGEVNVVSEGTGTVSCMVIPSRQGEGIGSKLLQATIDESISRGLRSLETAAIPGSPGERLVRKYGFLEFDPGADIKQLMAATPRRFLRLDL